MCNALYRLEVPFKPIGTDNFGNRFELITTTGTAPGGLYMHSMTTRDGFIYLFGGIAIEGGQQALKNDLYTFEIATKKWAKISKVLSTTNTQMRLWDGTKYPLVQVSNDIVARFSSLLYKSPTNKIIVFGGISKNLNNEYYPFKDVWNYEINLAASSAVLSKQETSFELFSK